MKVTHVLAASVIAGGLIFAGTGCSSNEATVDPSPSVSASVEPSAAPSATQNADAAVIGPDVNSTGPGITAPAETESPKAPETPIVTSEDSVAVMDTINSYYAFVVSPEATAALDKISKNFTTGEPTPEQLQAAVDSAPEVFTFYDSSTPENIKKAIQEFAMSAGMSSMGEDKLIFTAPAEAVTVNGDTAKLDVGAVIVTINDETINPGTSSGEDYLHFAKKDGKWLMIAKGIPTPDSSASPQ